MADKMEIRVARRDDGDAVRGVHLAAFSEGEGSIVSKLAVDLLCAETAPPVLSLVSEADGIIVGHVAFSPVWTRDTRELLGYILAPLAVSPAFQKRGIGSKLIKNGVERLIKLGSDLLLVYGDPAFYSRFGFTPDVAKNFTPPYSLQHPLGWQGLALGNRGDRKYAINISCVPSLNHPELW